MFVAGIQIVVSRPITLRASLIIGLSLLSALSVLFFPDFFRSLPPWTHQFTASEITVAVIVSVALNALFLLGTWRYSQLRLGAGETPLTAASFNDCFGKQAAEWKIDADDVQRVREVVDGAIEHIATSTRGPVNIRIGSDTFDIRVTLSYTGKLPNLPDARPKRDLVEEQSFVSGLTGYLSGLYADRIDQSAKGEECEVTLLFRL